MTILKNKIRSDINKQSFLMIFLFFFLTFYLLKYLYTKIVLYSFSDVVKNIHKPYHNLDTARLAYLALFAHYSNLIVIIILGLTCFYVMAFERKYFREYLLAFAMFIIVFVSVILIFPNFDRM